MPIYEYECNKCLHRFEVKQGFNDMPVAQCPQCNETARRVFLPAPIIFKGSGFYITDHRKNPPPETSAGESGAGQSTK
ncbi:MAG: FmdB family zinc ribbon protein [Chloroflexota bacterium]